jgi:hypothetical protein
MPGRRGGKICRVIRMKTSRHCLHIVKLLTLPAAFLTAQYGKKVIKTVCCEK